MVDMSRFCAVILTHKRPDRVWTLDPLRRCGYPGDVLLVVDDEDPTLEQYIERYGDAVCVFSKRDVEPTFDVGDNLDTRRGVVYARNACADIVRERGYQWFIQLDDDYKSFHYRVGPGWVYQTINCTQTLGDVFAAFVQFPEDTPTRTVALSQGGDWIGGISNLSGGVGCRRKAMNSFICSVDAPPVFLGRINEDTTTYLTEGRRGELWLTIMQVMLVQETTQKNSGGMTGLYLDHGTYIKTFYSVLYAPSCVQVGAMGDPRTRDYRFHHEINWRVAVPKIIRASHKK